MLSFTQFCNFPSILPALLSHLTLPGERNTQILSLEVLTMLVSSFWKCWNGMCWIHWQLHPSTLILGFFSGNLQGAQRLPERRNAKWKAMDMHSFSLLKNSACVTLHDAESKNLNYMHMNLMCWNSGKFPLRNANIEVQVLWKQMSLTRNRKFHYFTNASK